MNRMIRHVIIQCFRPGPEPRANSSYSLKIHRPHRDYPHLRILIRRVTEILLPANRDSDFRAIVLSKRLRPAIPRDQYDRAVDLYSKAPRGSVKMLLQLPYFANLHMDLVSDLYDYFVEVKNPFRVVFALIRR